MCVSIVRQSPRKFDRSVFTLLDSNVRRKCMDSYGSSEMALNLVN